MIKIEYFKPFCKIVDDNKLTLLFANKYFIIKKNGDIFDFVPHESTKIVVNLATKSIENTNDMFVFQKGEQLIKLPLYQLILFSNLMRIYLLPIIEDTIESIEVDTEIDKKEIRISRRVRKEAKELIHELEEENITRLVEKSLFNNDKVLFEQLMKLKKNRRGS